MFKGIVSGIKNFFADDPEDMDPEALVKLVADPETDPKRRQAAAVQLGDLSDNLSNMEASEEMKATASNRLFPALAALIGRAGDPPYVSHRAVQGLNEVANVFRYEMDGAVIDAVVDPLMAALGSQHNREVRSAAASALASIEQQIEEGSRGRAVEAIMDTARREKGELRADCLFALGSFDNEATGHLWDEVATYLGDSDAMVRAHSASALWMIGNESPDPSVVETLVGLVKDDRDESVKDDALNALGHLGRGVASVVPTLIDALGREATRHSAIFALMELEAEADAAVPALTTLIADDEDGDSVVMALQGIGTESARAALRAGGHPEEM